MSGASAADFEFDLGALSELFDCDFLGVSALDFGQEMEVGVELLGVVLVGVGAELVVVDGGVLPLLVGLYVQELHEGVKLNFIEFVSQILTTLEVSVFERNVGHLLERRILLFSRLLFSFLLPAFLSTLFTLSFFTLTLFLLFFLLLFSFSLGSFSLE